MNNYISKFTNSNVGEEQSLFLLQYLSAKAYISEPSSQKLIASSLLTISGVLI